ncbi:chaperone protein dnaJ 72 isoform X1 [Rhododendron vialii]|uniref:chaperone protein dnaJ 72 isoform X1 n=1 Tax=Rhododendron vialii TaxID=182163 RepID=UPI0026600BE6|nr:chaperone protein dnaJ 72 isoform X1 [Rhododendron vialii]
MDHYKALGLSRSASKEEIKQAFRKLAMQYHPDKHSHSPKPVRDNATLRFKLVSEAYEVLIDDRKRADYNLRSYNNNNNNYNYNNNNNGRRSNPSYGYGYDYRSGPKSRYSFYRGYYYDGFLTPRSILLNLAFTGVVLGGIVIIESSRDALWKLQNPGKSFEDAVGSIEKAKAAKDKV